MINGDDNDATPGPEILPQHRRHVEVLGAAIPVLNAAVNTLGEILHEIRIARDPIGASTLCKISSFGESIEKAGEMIKRGFEAA